MNYRILEVGEIIQEGDECRIDIWVSVIQPVEYVIITVNIVQPE